MYVHKNHIRQWVVHTFNLKRLDRENMGTSTAALKRTYDQMISGHEEDSCTNTEEPQAKRLNSEQNSNDGSSEEQNSITTKRVSKPVHRFDPMEADSMSINPKEK